MNAAHDGSGDAAVAPIVEVAPFSATHNLGPGDHDAPSIPTDLMSAARAVEAPGERAYYVPPQLPMAAFLYATGPDAVIKYNLNTVASKLNTDLARRLVYLPGGKKSPCDALQLTAAGTARLVASPTLQVYRQELACSAKSLHGKAPPNCQRVCGGIGVCTDDCAKGHTRHHGCAFRITVTASLEDVAAGRYHVQLSGTHVPDGTWAMPPPPNGLKTAPHVTARLARHCIDGIFPTVAVNNEAKNLGALNGVSSTRFLPPTKVLSARVKRERREERGACITDLHRVDRLVREVLIQRQLVLYYVPGEILVLSTPFLLERAHCDGQNFVVSDAKVDTVAGLQWKWSSIRGKSDIDHMSITLPYVVWMAPNENRETVALGATALRNAVRCSDPECDHAFQLEYNFDGRGGFKMTRSRCTPSFSPAVGLDKHMPSYQGFRAAGCARQSFCARVRPS